MPHMGPDQEKEAATPQWQSSSSDHGADFQAYMDKDCEVKHSAQEDKCGWLVNQAEIARTVAAHNDMQTLYQIAKTATPE